MKETAKLAVSFAHVIQDGIYNEILPPASGSPSHTDRVVYQSLMKGTRGYIEQIAHQINGCYENGWYDSCAVMIRRLVETLIVETFESHSLAAKIQNDKGDFFFLRELISFCINEATWNMSRNAKQALPKLKDVGDKSAHSRRYLAQRQDIDTIIPDLRVVVQELLYLSGIKK